MRKSSSKFSLLVIALILFACQPPKTPEPVSPTAALTASLPAAPTLTQAAPTSTPLPTSSPTPIPLRIEATVWEADPVIPILNYHRFTPNAYDPTSGMVRFLGDLKLDLQSYYDAGYSLISLDDLLTGNIKVPTGRRPLILTIDDAYFANQFFLNDQGDVSEYSAVGTIYKFSQEHPDFGFEIAMFANFGDKHFGKLFTGSRWYDAEGWEETLAQTIAWGIEHHVYPYNHTFRHAHLDHIAHELIQPQLALNDQRLREYLTLAGCPEDARLISNYIALPYGSYPSTEKGMQYLTAYLNPEGKPVRAVFGAGYEYRPAFASPPFTAGFDPLHIPRMAAIPSVINLITHVATTFPIAESCALTLPAGKADPQSISAAIQEAIANGTCPEGAYILDEGIFLAQGGAVSSYSSGF